MAGSKRIGVLTSGGDCAGLNAVIRAVVLRAINTYGWQVIGGYHELDLDALVVLGGDGSFRIMRRLAEQGGIDLVGIPKTIDNDISKTENAIGFVTAVNVATEALDRLQPTP